MAHGEGGEGGEGGNGGEDGGEGGDPGGRGGEGGDDGDGTAPPPQAQHMVLEEKSVSSAVVSPHCW